MYTICCFYTTGDSFRSEDTSDEVGYQWDKLESAKESLQFLREHYEYYDSMNGHGGKYKKNTKEPAYYKNEHSFPIRKNDGSIGHISAFFCGYFETLHSAEIIALGDTDMKISF